MAKDNENKPTRANWLKKALALGAMTSAAAIVFLSVTFFYPQSRADSSPPVGYGDAFPAGRLDDTDVTSSDKRGPDMMSFRISD
jgi:hypothetical protein